MTGERITNTVLVKVRLYAGLRRYLPNAAIGQAHPVELPSGSTVGNLLDLLGIPPNEAKNCFINGVQSTTDMQLQRGDEVGVFPPVGGGREEGTGDAGP